MHSRKFGMLFVLMAVLMLPLCVFGEGQTPAAGTMSVFEQDIVFSQIRPIVDLTVSASLSCSDLPTELPAGETLPSEFVNMVIADAAVFGSEVGADFASVTPSDKPLEWLSRNYDFPAGDVELSEVETDTSRYIGIMMMDIQPNETGSQLSLIGYVYIANDRFDALSEEDLANIQWLDMQAFLTLNKDDSASSGWKIASLRYQADLLADDTQQAEDYLTSSYNNEEFGFTVIYPAMFGANVQELENGVSAMLEDESASFSVLLTPINGRTIQTLVQDETTGIANAEIILGEDEKTAVVYFDENDIETYWYCQITEQGVLISQMRWNLVIHPEFERICEETFQTILPESDDLNG